MFPIMAAFVAANIILGIWNPKMSFKTFEKLGGTFMREGLLYHVDPADVPNPKKYTAHPWSMGGSN